MQIVKDVGSNHSFENVLTVKDNLLYQNKIALQKSEKIIVIANAIFEGIGLSGIISAAFWYATAPIAPDGFKGPIATYTIAVTTIASLIIAIPIAYIAYKRLFNNLERFFLDLLFETDRFDQNIEEIYFELLKLRTLFNDDSEFLLEIKPIMQSQIIELVGLEISKIYSNFKNKHYHLKWESEFSLSLISNEIPHNINSISFVELLKDKELANNKAIRKAIMNSVPKIVWNFQSSQVTKKLKNIIYASVASITCSEVFLSIGWTLASILIGVKIINPISIQNWLLFATFCVVTGFLFGLGIYLGNVKQTKRNLFKEQIYYHNNILVNAKENLNFIMTKKFLKQRKIANSKINLNAGMESKVILSSKINGAKLT